MKKDLTFKIIKIFSVVLSIFNLLMFFAMRCCWSGISKTLGYEKSGSWLILNLPVIVCVLFLLIAILNTTLYFVMKKDRNKWSIILSIVDVVLFIAIMVIIALGAIDYLRFIWVEFFKSLAVVAIVLVLLFFIFVYPKTKLKDSKVFKLVCLGLLVIGSCGYLVNFSINSITYKPVVYAVENTYQIIFSSNSNALGWVEIGDVEYYDLASGSQKSFTKVHKITVPMDALDNAKSYTIHCQKMIYRGPFGGIKGREIVEQYNFRPVDSSDGIEYFSVSDVHMDLKDTVKTASYANMELLVLNGDIISMMDTFADANYHNKVAFEMTKGEIPVIYARGNHELKGKMAEEFYKFTASKGEDFFYSFYLDGIYGLVLDIGEDHDDKWWEYYGTANYDEYRQRQIDFLNDELRKKEYEKYDYRMVVCHVPIVYVNSRKDHEYCKAEFTKILNQMDIDMALSGHQHDILVFEPNTIPSNEKLPYNEEYKKGTFKGYVTDFNFPNLLVSKRGYTQTDDNNLTNVKSQIGLYVVVDFKSNTQTCTYLNSLGEKVNIVNPFADIDYGTDIVISLDTNEFE